jgi:hypothetical protein
VAGRTRFHWRAPINAILGARLGVVFFDRLIEGLDLWPGTKHQYLFPG